jgi:hypothetical protein
MRALTAHRKTAAMAVSTVAVDAQYAFHVHLNLAAKVTFDRQLHALDNLCDQSDLLIGELTSAGVWINLRRGKNFAADGETDAVNVGQRVLDLFVVGDFDS